MIYLHEEDLGKDYGIYHWSNEVKNKSSKNYYTPTYKILQVDTGILYDDAIDSVSREYQTTEILIEG